MMEMIFFINIQDSITFTENNNLNVKCDCPESGSTLE